MPTKTTVYLDPAEYARLRRLAEARGVSAAALIREAVAEYAARQDTGPMPRSLGLGRSGSVAARAEELLARRPRR